MGYPTRLLNPGEQVAVDVRPHWKYLFGPVFAVAVLVAGAITALVEDVPNWALLAVAVVLLVCLIWLAVRYVKWATTSFVVTNDRLILRKGVARRSGREILLDRLTDISYNQTLLDRLTGCGDILLESPGKDSQEVFEDLPHPVSIQNEIYRLVNDRHAGGAVPGPVATAGSPMPGTASVGAGAPEPSVADQLTQLDEMRKRGLINRREFAAKKADLLSRM